MNANEVMNNESTMEIIEGASDLKIGNCGGNYARSIACRVIATACTAMIFYTVPKVSEFIHNKRNKKKEDEDENKYIQTFEQTEEGEKNINEK